MKKIGFIGLGQMGTPMVLNLLAAGYAVTVYDLNQDAVKSLAEQGATPASCLRELHGQSCYISMLQTGAQVKEIHLEASDALMNMASPGTLFIDCSSIDVDSAKYLHEAANARQLAFIDAPVSGGIAGAKAGSLTIMVGGEEAVFVKAKPLLHILGAKLIHTGGAGTGQAAKICNNMILGISMIAISEAYVLAKKLGLSQKKLFEVSSNASGQCWAMSKYSPVPGLVDNVPSNNDYQPGFTAQMMLKDLKLSQAAAHTALQSTPLGKRATDIYQRYVDAGSGMVDFSGIIQLIEQGAFDE